MKKQASKKQTQKKSSRVAVLLGLGVLALGITAVAASATSRAPMDSLPLAKQAIEDNYAKLKENAAKPAPKSTDTSLKPVNHEQLPTGILDSFTPPFHSEDVTITNMWQKQEGGQLVQVYAGQLAGDTDQGVIIVRTTDADGITTTEDRIVTKEKAGSMKITADGNGKLSMKAVKGSSYEFDVKGKGLAKKQ
ncbi:hypothetical protein [Tumebacillus flagellatus]|uniref:Uncharacterized protein n=1 Tax=Tumebacillus flagellatus TaxID=1157490 RepID=A0A074MAD9_9BACL|nr:hypothetical protein [Tumebacillus flagellatus]KEO82902.1 hypothetical protein EL26_12455 [Tumebacillus flagellatus]